MYRVDFSDVGRSHKNFSVNMEEINYDNLYEAVKPYLLSSFSIGFALNDEVGVGVVEVGFYRMGTFKIHRIDDEETELQGGLKC